MPEKETIERAREDAREGKSRSTQAGEFVPRAWRKDEYPDSVSLQHALRQ